MKFQTENATFVIDADGKFSEIIAKISGQNYLAIENPSPIIQINVNNQWYFPDTAQFDEKSGKLTLKYNTPNIMLILYVLQKKSHITMEILEIQPIDKVEMVWWGPYATSIGDIVGEVVGVVRNMEFAIGIQALNPQTIGGTPEDEEDDIMNGRAMDDPGNYTNLDPELKISSPFRGSTAWPTKFGSILQMFCRMRNKERIIKNWGHNKFISPPLKDGTIIGSKIALFGCPASQALDLIGEIEMEESLPHPLIEGVWAKKSPFATCSYLIVDFGEQNIDQAIALTKRAGLNGLYHSSPFITWGHFRLRPDLFPNGWNGFKRCVDKAKMDGIVVGFHTLSNFTTPGDPYVSPIPDPRLAKIGYSPLSMNIDDKLQDIPIENPEYFQKETELNTVVIGTELIHYTSVSKQSPWKLLECERGEWGTQATNHKKGEMVGKLMDHGYKVFLTNMDLAQEEARTIADFCNNTGALRLSMDGLEGILSAGHGQYGRVLFFDSWYNALSPELKGQVRNDASNPAHYNWHINTYFNWGEPWYAGFRESQTLSRFKNQVFYERNYLPKMLGWFSLRPDTSLEDAEWLLARAAGFDAGFTLALSHESTAQLIAVKNAIEESLQRGATAEILQAIKEWETARIGDAFPDNIRAILRDNKREFHLEPVSPGEWKLLERQPNSKTLKFCAKIQQKYP